MRGLFDKQKKISIDDFIDENRMSDGIFDDDMLWAFTMLRGRHNTQSQTLRKTSDWNVNGKENGRPSVRWKNKSTWTLNKMVFHG